MTHLSGFLSYLICWLVSLSGPAYHSHYCWLWWSSLGLSLENSKEECSTGFRARSKILTRSVCCSQSLRLLEDDYNQLSGFRWATPLPSQALTYLLTPGSYFQLFAKHVQHDVKLRMSMMELLSLPFTTSCMGCSTRSSFCSAISILSHPLAQKPSVVHHCP